jgi:hypothetical protein
MLRSIIIIGLTAIVAACGFNDNRKVEQRTVKLSVSEVGDALEQATPGQSIKVMTLNLAHGRKDSINQWLVSSEQIRDNLDAIADYLKQADLDLVALQEADGPSGLFTKVCTQTTSRGAR